MDDGRVVDQDVEAAQSSTIRSMRRSTAKASVMSTVKGELSAGQADGLGGLRHTGAVAVEERDLGAMAGKRARRGRSYPSAGSGDDATRSASDSRDSVTRRR